MSFDLQKKLSKVREDFGFSAPTNTPDLQNAKNGNLSTTTIDKIIENDSEINTDNIDHEISTIIFTNDNTNKQFSFRDLMNNMSSTLNEATKEWHINIPAIANKETQPNINHKNTTNDNTSNISTVDRKTNIQLLTHINVLDYKNQDLIIELQKRNYRISQLRNLDIEHQHVRKRWTIKEKQFMEEIENQQLLISQLSQTIDKQRKDYKIQQSKQITYDLTINQQRIELNDTLIKYKKLEVMKNKEYRDKIAVISALKKLRKQNKNGNDFHLESMKNVKMSNEKSMKIVNEKYQNIVRELRYNLKNCKRRNEELQRNLFEINHSLEQQLNDAYLSIESYDTMIENCTINNFCKNTPDLNEYECRLKSNDIIVIVFKEIGLAVLKYDESIRRNLKRLRNKSKRKTSVNSVSVAVNVNENQSESGIKDENIIPFTASAFVEGENDGNLVVEDGNVSVSESGSISGTGSVVAVSVDDEECTDVISYRAQLQLANISRMALKLLCEKAALIKTSNDVFINGTSAKQKNKFFSKKLKSGKN